MNWVVFKILSISSGLAFWLLSCPGREKYISIIYAYVNNVRFYSAQEAIVDFGKSGPCVALGTN
jgi:hypothetical protein